MKDNLIKKAYISAFDIDDKNLKRLNSDQYKMFSR